MGEVSSEITAGYTLRNIIDSKRREVSILRDRMPPTNNDMVIQGQVQSRRPFIQALRDKVYKGEPGIIAEIKYESPGRGFLPLGNTTEPRPILYERGGAACISIVTDRKFFGGDKQGMFSTKAMTKVPILRKDFILDEIQVRESAACGADAILLIPSLFNRFSEGGKIHSIARLAWKYKMDVLVEFHTPQQFKHCWDWFERFLDKGNVLFVYNRRNLETFELDPQSINSLLFDSGIINTSGPGRHIRPDYVLDHLIVASGIKGGEVPTLRQESGVQMFLVGTGLMAIDNPDRGIRYMIDPEGTWKESD